MPAIPVYARVEAAMSDDELKALHRLLGYLVKGAYSGAQSLFLDAAQGDAHVSGAMLTAACTVHAATARCIRERNLTA